MGKTVIKNKIFITKTYSYTVSNWAGSSGVNIAATNFNASTPEGYTPIGVIESSTNNSFAVIHNVNPKAVDTEIMAQARNYGSTATVTFTITILYVPTDLVKIL